MAHIAVFVGSLRAGSLNHLLATNLEALAPEGTVFSYVDIGALPLFNQDLESDFPVAAQAMKDLIESADGVLFVTPEYNRSIPGVLKNAIDWASRPGGAHSFAGKPAGIVGASPGSLGTGAAQAHLRSILVYLDTKLMGQPEIYLSRAATLFDATGAIVDESKQFLEAYIAAFVEHVESSR